VSGREKGRATSSAASFPCPGGGKKKKGRRKAADAFGGNRHWDGKERPIPFQFASHLEAGIEDLRGGGGVASTFSHAPAGACRKEGKRG